MPPPHTSQPSAKPFAAPCVAVATGLSQSVSDFIVTPSSGPTSLRGLFPTRTPVAPPLNSPDDELSTFVKNVHVDTSACTNKAANDGARSADSCSASSNEAYEAPLLGIISVDRLGLRPGSRRDVSPKRIATPVAPTLMGRLHVDKLSVKRPEYEPSIFVKYVQFDTFGGADKDGTKSSDRSTGVSNVATEAMTTDSLGLRPQEQLAGSGLIPERMVAFEKGLRAAEAIPELLTGQALSESGSLPEVRVGSGAADVNAELRKGSGASHDDSGKDAENNEDYLSSAYGIPSVDLPCLCVGHALRTGDVNVSGSSRYLPGGISKSSLAGYGGEGAHSVVEARSKPLQERSLSAIEEEELTQQQTQTR